MKMISIDDIIKICDTNIVPLKARGQGVAVAALRRVIDAAKEYAVDAEFVKHGRWIRGENKGFPEKPSMIWYCSICGERIMYNDTLRTYQKIKKSVSQINSRCRNCGARMDGDVNER